MILLEIFQLSDERISLRSVIFRALLILFGIVAAIYKQKKEKKIKGEFSMKKQKIRKGKHYWARLKGPLPPDIIKVKDVEVKEEKAFISGDVLERDGSGITPSWDIPEEKVLSLVHQKELREYREKIMNTVSKFFQGVPEKPDFLTGMEDGNIRLRE